MRRPLPLNSPCDAVLPAANATTTNNKDYDAAAADNDNDNDDDDDDDDAADTDADTDANANADEEKLPAIMPPKKKTAAASETKAVDAITDACVIIESSCLCSLLDKGHGCLLCSHRHRGWRMVCRSRLEPCSCTLQQGWVQGSFEQQRHEHTISEGGVFILLYDQAPSGGSEHCLQPGK